MLKVMIKIFSQLIAKLNSSSASRKRVLIQFDEEIHCEIVNKDEEKGKTLKTSFVISLIKTLK